MKQKKIINTVKFTIISILFIFLWMFDLIISLTSKDSIKFIWKLETSIFEPIEDSNGNIIEFKLIKSGEETLKETLIILKNKYL